MLEQRRGGREWTSALCRGNTSVALLTPAKRSAWLLTASALAGALVVACTSGAHWTPPDADAADAADEEAAVDAYANPTPDASTVDVANLYVDSCSKSGLSCSDNSQCCSNEVCEDSGCQLPARQQ
jgi:hypothetical protein